MITVKESVIIKTKPENIWNFLTSLHKEGVYKQWHEKDHIVCKLLKGNGTDVGSVLYATEYVGKHIVRLKYKLVTSNYPHYLEYKVVFPSSLIIKGGGSFTMQPIDNLHTNFTAYIGVGVKVHFLDKLLDKIIAIFFKTDDLVQHVREEGENIRKIMEKSE